MEIVEEWAGCSLELGLTGTKSKGLASWAAAWGLSTDGGAVFMEIWREHEQTLFSGGQTHNEIEAVKTIYQQAVSQKRFAGYIAAKFNDARRGDIPSFSGGEGVAIAASGIASASDVEGQALNQESLARAMKSFRERLQANWSGQANAKILLVELRQIQQRVEAYCDASTDRTACAQLQENLAATKAAVQAVLTA